MNFPSALLLLLLSAYFSSLLLLTPTSFPADHLQIKLSRIWSVSSILFLTISYNKPEKPQNAIAIRPAVNSTVGIPLKGSGISLCSIFSRNPAKMTIAMVKPKGCCKTVYNTLYNAVLLLHIGQGHAKHSAVGGNQGQTNAKGLDPGQASPSLRTFPRTVPRAAITKIKQMVWRYSR